MRLDTLLYMFLFASIFMVGGVVILTSFASQYGENNNITGISSNSQVAELMRVGNITNNDVSAIGRSMENPVLNGSTTTGVDSWGSMAQGAYTALRFTKNIFPIGRTMIYALTDVLGIPAWVTTTVLTFLTLIIIFAIITMIFRYVGD